jgi:hypothetical protein
MNYRDFSRHDAVFFDAPILAHLMEQCQSLKVLNFFHLNTLDEGQLRVLGDYSRPGLEIQLVRCVITEAATRELMQVLGSNQGPTMLLLCGIDEFVLAYGLRGNSSLKSLVMALSSEGYSSDLDAGNREAIAIAGGLKENRGLVDFNLRGEMCDEAWGAVCDSLKTHPTLQILNLWSTMQAPLGPAVINSWIQALLDMLKVNISIHTIDVDCCYRNNEDQLFEESVIPYLETNRFRPRVRAIQITRAIVYRAKVLGQALLAARTDANSFWMLLSGNPEVAFPPTTAIAAAVSLPDITPATSNADVSTSTTGSSGAATPTPGQKRKARR